MHGDAAAGMAEIIPYLIYRDVPAALAWLAGHLGFEETLRSGTESGGMHGEMRFGGRRIMLGAAREEWKLRTPDALGAASAGVFIYMRGVLAHHAHAVAAGVRVSGPPADHGYGLTYTAYDLDGHPWYFTEAPAV